MKLNITNRTNSECVPDGKHELLERLVTHIVLPRVMTKTILNDPEKQHLLLIERMVDAIVSSKLSPDTTVATFQRFKRVHNDSSAKNVSKEINNLQPGDTFAMLVRSQRCVFMIHRFEDVNDTNDKTDDNCETSDTADSTNNSVSVTIATFPSNIDPKDIYSHSSDFQVNFDFVILFCQ